MKRFVVIAIALMMVFGYSALYAQQNDSVPGAGAQKGCPMMDGGGRGPHGGRGMKCQRMAQNCPMMKDGKCPHGLNCPMAAQQTGQTAAPQPADKAADQKAPAAKQ